MTKTMDMQSTENSRKFPRTLTECEFKFVNDYLQGKRSRRDTIDFLLHAQSTSSAPDRFDCAACGQSCPKTEKTLEHVVPKGKVRSGPKDISNEVITCVRCNALKCDKYSLAETRDELRLQGKEVDEVVGKDVSLRVLNAREWCLKGHDANPYASVLHVGIEGPLRSPGWNFVGFPYEPADSSIGAIFTSDIDVRTAYAYDPAIPGGWQVAVRETLNEPWQGDLTHLTARNGYCVLSDAEHQEIRIPVK